MRNLWIGKLASAMVIARQKKEREKKEREERACSRRVGTFQLNCKLKRIFYSRVVSTIGSDRKYSKTRQRLLSRIKFAISVPFSFSIISSMISQTSTVNRILFADFQPALFRNCFQYGEWRASILPSFYSSPSISNSGQHRSRYFTRITISLDSSFAVETDRNTTFYGAIFAQIPPSLVLSTTGESYSLH